MLPKGLRSHRILGGPLKGCRIVTSWRDYPAAILGRTERPLLQWFETNVKRGETWLDVGAHYGYTAIALSRLVGVGGRVFAFEPMLASAGCLARTRSLNNYRQLSIVPIALGNPITDWELARLGTVRGMVDNTLETSPNPGDSWFESFLVSRLDSLWGALAPSNSDISGIKIDVQGLEIQALLGMQALLRHHQPKLVVELHRGVSRDEFLRLILDLGYQLPGIPVEPIDGEHVPQYYDDRSYAFFPLASPVKLR